MEQILTKVLNSQVKPTSAKWEPGVQCIADPVNLWPFLAVPAAWSQYILAQLQKPQEKNGGCRQGSLYSLSLRETQPNWLTI